PVGAALISNREADGFKTDENLVNFITSSKPQDREAAVKAFDEVFSNPNGIEKADPRQLAFIALQIGKKRQAEDALAESGPALTPALGPAPMPAASPQVPAPTAQVGSPPAPATPSSSQPASPTSEQHQSRQQIL